MLAAGVTRVAGGVLAYSMESPEMIYSASRNPTTADTALHEIQSAGEDAAWVQADVGRAVDVEAMVIYVIKTFGRLDFAFNNGESGGRGGWLAEIEEPDWDPTIDGYLKSVWLCMKYEIQAMFSAGGVIVNNSSVDGLRALPDDPIYSAAKHGVIGLTKSAALQYAQRGIRINAVCSGWIRTPPTDDWIAAQPEMEGRMLMHQPIGRLGEANEVAEAIVWLCSSNASLIIGVSLPVDGGYTVI